jgi:hypothetical protein
MSDYAESRERAPYAGRRQGDIIGAFTDAVRDNPLPAALIGMGALWLFMGGNKVSLLGGHHRTSLLGTVAHGAGDVAQGATHMAGRMGSAVASGVSSTASTVGSGVSEAASRVGDAAGRMGDYVRGAVHGVDAQSEYHTLRDDQDEWGAVYERNGHDEGSSRGASMRHGMQDMFERHPMALGLAGLALGAGVAAALPLTQTERETGEAARGKMSEAASRARELAGAVAEEVKQQAGGMQASGSSTPAFKPGQGV